MTLQEKLAAALANARKAIADGNVDDAAKFKKEAEDISGLMKSASELDALESSNKSAPMRPGMPTNKVEDKIEEDNSGSMKAVYTMRFGDDTVAKTAVLRDLIGPNYQQTLWDQSASFAKYLRNGENHLDREEAKLLKTQVFAFEDISAMIKNGFSVSSIKSTMVEAQGSLGGYAVPATMQSEILRRLPGLTVVRSSGATVVNLTNGNSTEVMEITGGDDRYTGAIRGAWGSETQSPAEKNMTLGIKSLNADVYTYKVPMSTSLVEDASNLVSLLQDEATTTFAMDEDDAFLVGDGVGKPLGIMPAYANALGLTEVVTGHATLMTADGLKALKRGIAAQYRKTGIWVANSDTYLAIEKLVDANGQYLMVDNMNDLTDQDTLLKRKAYESEAMTDIAANAFPLLFGNMAGYWIVERSGMTVMRMQDSYTGINKVEYHFRRRIGGRVTKKWMFAVQKVSAS